MGKSALEWQLLQKALNMLAYFLFNIPISLMIVYINVVGRLRIWISFRLDVLLKLIEIKYSGVSGYLNFLQSWQSSCIYVPKITYLTPGR
mgnify:CR=1 FL=1